jgi:hypothetical protein
MVSMIPREKIITKQTFKIPDLSVGNGALLLVVVVALLHAVALELGYVTVVARVDVLVHALEHVLAVH